MENSFIKQKLAGMSKRLRISRAQRMTLLEVAITSLIVGAAIVLIVFLGKYIGLNGRVIGAKDEALNNYSRTIANVGICEDKNRDGKVDAGELNNCHPNDITLDRIPDTLQSNVMTKTAYDKALESVAKHDTLSSSCLDASGKSKNFLKEYQEAKTESSKKKALDSIKTCSALRIIPDALPAQQNIEGASASLNWLLKQAGVRYESLTPGDDNSGTSDNTSVTASSVDSIPLSLVLETSTQNVYRALATVERSIRTFDVDSMTIEWGGSGSKLSFTIKTRAYYSGQLTVDEKTKTVTTQGVR